MSATKVFLNFQLTNYVDPDVISIALVAETGEEFYAENLEVDTSTASDFALTKVFPLLKSDVHGMLLGEMSAAIWNYFTELDTNNAIIVTEYNSDFETLVFLMGGIHPKLAAEYESNNAFMHSHGSIKALSTGKRIKDVVDECRFVFFSKAWSYFQLMQETPNHALHAAKAVATARLETENWLKTFNVKG